MDTVNLLVLIKVLTILEVPTNSKIFLSLLNLIRHQVNDIPINRIRDMHFLLNKQQPLPIVEALKLALPMVFKLRFKETDFDDLPLWLNHLDYAAHNANAISYRLVQRTVNVLYDHRNKLSVDDAIPIIYNLSAFKHTSVNFNALIVHCINIVVVADIGFLKALELLSVLCKTVSI